MKTDRERRGRARVELVERLSAAELREVSDLLASVGMRTRDVAAMRRAIASSVAVSVVREGAAIVGFGRLIGDGVYYGSIWDVATAPGRQAAGIGSAVVERLLRVARRQKLKIVGLFTAIHNRSFYERFGFRLLEDVHPMTLRLTPPRKSRTTT